MGFGNYTSEEVLSVGYQLLGWSALLMLFVGIFSNGFVLLSIVCSRHLRIIGYLFSVNLFATDLLVSIALFPVLILSVLDFDDISGGTCLVLAFVHSLLTKASQLSVALLAFDRYKSIIHCLRYNKEHADLSYVLKGVCFVWLQALVLTTLAVFVADNSERHWKGMCIVVPANTDIFALVMFGLPFCETLCALLFCYSKIICIARQHTRQIKEHRRSSNSGNSTFDQQGIIAMTMAHRIPRLTLTPNLLAAQTKHLRQFIRSGSSTTDIPSFGLPNPNNPKKKSPARARLCGYVTVFIMCWLPVVVNVFIGAPDDFVTAVTVILSLFNSVLNPFLYAIASKRYRSQISRILEQRKRREEKEERKRRERYEEALAKIAVLYRQEEQHQSHSDITPVGS